ncbi:MAG: hypothetical protein QOJ65_2727, partial [Fimbriimonadaceae bacterium]|nr:hypothetical protein [Fimbriimonadaceae bacterium]
MIARMLNLCGLYLGTEEELHPAQPDNPEGFWEHIRIQDINDRLLEMHGGAWDKAPNFRKGWQNDPKLEGLRNEAYAVVAEMGEHGIWGWKDPRNSLTLPFWKAVIPDLKVIVPIRNPIDVGASLKKRGYASQAFGFDLWETYMDALEADLATDSAIYTHYSAYFQNPREELLRVAAFCGLRPSEEQIDAACKTVSGGLRHSDSTVLDLLSSGASLPLIQQYFDACVSSGPVYEETLRKEAMVATAIEREKALKDKDATIIELRSLTKHLERSVDLIQTQMRKEREDHRQAAARMVEVERRAAQAFQAELESLRAEFNAVQNSAGWPALVRINQSRPLRAVVKGLRKWRAEGLGSVLKAAGRKVGGSSPAPAVAMQGSPTLDTPTPATVVEVLKISSTPIAGEALLRAISAAMKHPRFALAISHDSFQAFTGGIQTLINDERKALDLGGASQVHACPVERINRHSTDDRLDLIVSVDGKPLCVADSREFVNALTALTPDAPCVSVQVHHTMNWSIGALDELLSKFPDAPKFFWIHDYYTVCEGYNLLRNDRAFCNAPPVDSNSCSICKYGVHRPEHLAAMKAFLDRWGFEFLAPSTRAAEVWLKGYPEHKDRLKVTPIYDLVPTETQNVRPEPNGRKIRVAFPGISYEFKGWSGWRRLVDALQNNSDYELIHLGQKTEALQHTTFPERFRRVRSGPENAHALPDALQEENVDIVFYCPIWP